MDYVGWYYWEEEEEEEDLLFWEGGKDVMKRWDLSLVKTATERYNYEYVQADCSTQLVPI